ncbi:MAG: bifunctional glutamate N-acetyltransferase/amino-acid acetyltransferase ArgJ [Oscillospiraceae bacterium]|jgi:glutamate N-acetyltransferase/amino-acid N-acetyltransferase
MEYIEGGVCAPKGFVAGGINCGIRNHEKRDLALIVSRTPASAAGVYTQNLVKGAPITVTQKHIEDGYARAIICNSGNANTCNPNGVSIAEGMCELVEMFTGIKQNDIIVASTGVIGQELKLEPIAYGMPDLMLSLGNHSDWAAEAIMTTDTFKKELAAKFMVGARPVKIGAIAKGSGMICPNMATMLVFITTDAKITPAMLQKALSDVVQDSFNMISVDRDTSTNDMCIVLANGLAENEEIYEEGPRYEEFKTALLEICIQLAKSIAKDGEGATKLLECRVTGGKTQDDARKIAKSIICSNLLKCAMFGSDANWGRVLCAIGYAGAETDVSKIAVTFKSAAGEVNVCRNGGAVEFSEELAKTVLSEDEIIIDVALSDGSAAATAYGCDLSYDYVKINGDYRS